MRYSFCDSAQGPLLVAIDQDGLRFVEFVRGEQPVIPRAQWQRDDVALAPYLEQFEAYFAGRLRRLTLPLAASGTPSPPSVWRALTPPPARSPASRIAVIAPKALMSFAAKIAVGGLASDRSSVVASNPRFCVKSPVTMSEGSNPSPYCAMVSIYA